MAEMTDDQMRVAIKAAREVAQSVGPMHALWDTIFDAEAILAGRPSLLKRDDIERILNKRQK